MDTGGSTARYFGQWAEHREGINRRLIHGPGIDAILAEVTSASGTPAQVWSLGRDGSGHVTHVDAVDTGGAPTASTLRRYSAFGVPREAAPAQSIERGFASRPIEGASGLVYMRARHYDPTTGRFLQPDPEGIASTQRYAFAEHNPYIYNDPTGRSSRGIGSLDRGVPSWTFEGGGGTALPLIGEPGFSLADRFHNLAFGDGAGIFRPEIDAAFDYAYGAVDDALGNYPSAVLQPVMEVLTWGDPCQNCNIGIVSIPGRGLGGTAAKAARTGRKSLQRFYPDNDGFLPGTKGRTFLRPGDEIDRFGFDGGRFFAPRGTPAPMRALRPGSEKSPFSAFRVLKPFEVEAGTIAPAFGQVGFGTQFRSAVPARVLLKRGIIERINP